MYLNRCVVALLLLSALVSGSRGDEPKPRVPVELEWVPPNCAGFIHVRVHELWISPGGKKLFQGVFGSDPKVADAIENTLGVPLAHIDTVTVVLASANDLEREPGFVLRITTTKPYDRRDVLSALKVREDRERPASKFADLFVIPGSGFVHLGDEHTITLLPGENGGVGLLAKFLGRPASGPLTLALQAAAGRSQIVAGINFAALPRLPAEAFPPELKSLRTLLDARSATISGTLADDKSAVEMRVAFAGKDDAAEGKQAIADGLKALQDHLAMLEKESKGDSKEAAAQLAVVKQIRTALSGATVALQDADVVASAQLPSADPLATLLGQGAELIRAGSYRTQSQNNLKQIGLAFHNFHDTFGELPANAIYDKNGKPLLSWRVAILPFIEQDNLYKQFHLDEPWDSDHNKKLIAQMPKIYALPGDTKKHDLPSTYYQGFFGPHAAFDGKKGLKFPVSFPDGTSNTIWTAEAEIAVPWTKPDDLVYDPAKMPKIGFHYGDRCNVGFADGSVRALKRSIPANVWHLLIQRDDGNVIPNVFDD